MSRMMKKALVLALVMGFVIPRLAAAWGERGHDIVTRVAVRLLAEKVAKGTPLALQFGRKEFMLGHLSNVPDIVWRNQGEAIEKMNAPTHFMDLEYLSPEVTFATIPRTAAEVVSTDYVDKPVYNQVHVGGIAAGVFGPWKRAGRRATRRPHRSPMRSSPMRKPSASAHGPCLSDTGSQALISSATPGRGDRSSRRSRTCPRELSASGDLK